MNLPLYTPKTNIQKLQLRQSLLHIIDRNDRKHHRHFNPAYEDSELRKNVIENQIKSLCIQLQLQQQTFYLAIALIDSISSKFLLDTDAFAQMSLVCLSLATRVRESQIKVHLLNSCEQIQSLPNRRHVEHRILIELGFDVNVVTPFDIAMLLLSFEQSFSGVCHSSKKLFCLLISKLMYSSSLEYTTNKFNALVVALSAMMAVRRHCGCEQPLPVYFEKLTGYSQTVLMPCFKQIYFLSQTFFKRRNSKNSPIGRKNESTGHFG